MCDVYIYIGQLRMCCLWMQCLYGGTISAQFNFVVEYKVKWYLSIFLYEKNILMAYVIKMHMTVLLKQKTC